MKNKLNTTLKISFWVTLFSIIPFSFLYANTANSSSSSTVEVAALVTLSVGLLRIVETLIMKKFNSKKEETNEESNMIRDIHSWLNVRDDTGVFVWYRSGEFEKTMARIAKSEEKMAASLQTISLVLKNMDRILEKLEANTK